MKRPMDKNIKLLYREITESYHFDRLHDVSFLGIIDYLNLNNADKYQARFTRADHTYGVYELSDYLVGMASFSKDDSLLIAAVALCHDMGHSAFSHSLERAYRKIDPSISHRTVVEEILRDRNSDVGMILHRYNVDIERLIGLCNGNNLDPLNWIFHDPINVDTVDGIYRFFLSFKLFPAFDRHRCIEVLFKAYSGHHLSPKDLGELDSFWEAKGSFYEEFLLKGAFAEYEANFIELASKSKVDIGSADFFQTEKDVVKSLDWDNIGSFKQSRRVKKLPKTQFLINKSVSVNSLSDLRLRYERSKRSD